MIYIHFMTKKIAIFASGSGTNAEKLIQYFQSVKTIEIPLILSNKVDALAHQRAQKLNIKSFTFSKKDFDEGTKIVDFLRTHNIDGIVLAGFLLKISSPLIQAFAGKIINIHPALLPQYGGCGMYGMNVHQAVYDAGEHETGITIHHINQHYDDGAIIFQASCPITPQDTPHTIAQKVQLLEHTHYPQVIEHIFTT